MLSSSQNLFIYLLYFTDSWEIKSSWKVAQTFPKSSLIVFGTFQRFLGETGSSGSIATSKLIS